MIIIFTHGVRPSARHKKNRYRAKRKHTTTLMGPGGSLWSRWTCLPTCFLKYYPPGPGPIDGHYIHALCPFVRPSVRPEKLGNKLQYNALGAWLVIIFARLVLYLKVWAYNFKSIIPKSSKSPASRKYWLVQFCSPVTLLFLSPHCLVYPFTLFS